MTLTRKHILIGLAGFVCLGIVVVVSYFALLVYLFSEESGTDFDKQSAIECTLEWGRLAPFPPSAAEFSITKHGNMFTRQFRTSFTAPRAEIERWLKESPGTRETTPTVPSPGIRHFQIKPGGGAQRAEVSIDDSTNLVSINVSWS